MAGGMRGGGGGECVTGALQSGCAWQGECMAGGVCVARGHAWQGGVHGKGYASWNAFLFFFGISAS